MEGRIRTRLSVSEGRRFGLTVGIAFLVIAAVLVWRERSLASQITGGLGGALVLGGLLLPTWLGPVERAWMALAHAISKVTTPIFLGIVYYVVMTPMGLLRRAIGGNALRHDASANDTYWKDTDSARSGGLERQF